MLKISKNHSVLLYYTIRRKKLINTLILQVRKRPVKNIPLTYRTIYVIIPRYD
jgi:hypothetical protein